MTAHWKNRLLGAVATGAIIAGLFPAAALGAGARILDTDKNNDGKPDYSLTVGGLDKGDSAVYYQIIDLDSDTTNAQGTVTQGSQNWKLHSNVDADGDGIVDGTESASFGHKNDKNEPVNGLFVDELVITDEDATDKRAITADMANALAAAIATNSATATSAGTAGEDGKIAVDDAAAGLYMFYAIPGEDNVTTVYKPIFVSADYYNNVSTPDDGTHQITLVADDTDYLGNKGVFKRSTLSVDKKSGVYEDGACDDTQHDVAVGDVVDFTITSVIPTYTKNYANPQYKITDVVTKGLLLTDATGSESAAVDAIAEAIDVTVEGYKLTRDIDYKVTVDSNKQFYTIEFLNDADPETDADENGTKDDDKDGFLYTVLGGPKVTITYKALVTDDAAEKTQMDNTVRLNFSDNPTDASSEDTLEDKTRHYTFNVDGEIFGKTEVEGGSEDPSGSENKTSEVRKVSVDSSKTLTTETPKTKDVPATPSDYEWLEGAEFELKQISVYKGSDSTNDGVSDGHKFESITPTTVTFDSSTHIKSADGENPKSDANGYISMKGLDAGEYTLSEITAPLGYTYDPSLSYKITIKPTYVTENPSSTDEEDVNEILASYTITIEKLKDGKPVDPAQKAVSTYTTATDDTGKPLSFLNDSFSDKGTPVTDPEKKEGFTVTLDESSLTTLIENKKLGLLPATGGSGIIFYLVVGGAVAALASFLLSKTKEEDTVA